MTIFEFAKLHASKKEELLHGRAMLLESYTDNDKRITVYYMPSFFIEVSTCIRKNKVIDITPYHRGYAIGKKTDRLYEAFNERRFLLVAC